MRTRETIEKDEAWTDPNRDWTSEMYIDMKQSLILEVLLDIRDLLHIQSLGNNTPNVAQEIAMRKLTPPKLQDETKDI